MLSSKLQLPGQTSNFVQYGKNVSRGWPMQAVARLQVCTMRINTELYYCTLLSPGLQCIGHFGTLLLLYNLFFNNYFLYVLCYCPHH